MASTPQKLKIGIVCPYNMFRSGGVQDVVRNHYKYLKARGHTVKILTINTPDAKETEDYILLGASIEVTSGSTRFEISGKLPELFDISGKSITEVLEQEKFDILHFHEPRVPILPVQILLKSQTTNVATVHATNPNSLTIEVVNQVVRPYQASHFLKMDAVSTVSTAPLEDLRKLYKRDITIIHNGIDLEEFNRPYPPLEKFTSDNKKRNILYVGRLEKRKGVMHLVKAYREVKQQFPDCRLIIAGKGEELQRIKTYVQKYKLKDVEFLGYVDEEMKKRLYVSCDVFCSPAFTGESFGIVLLEAMAFGKPIVAGDNPGYRYVLKDRGSLFLVDPRNHHDFADKLFVLLKDQELREFMGEWGKEEVKKYDYKVIVEDLEKFYYQAISSKFSRPNLLRKILSFPLRLLGI